jgi:tetratricopeptide (TPR) repeat protein
MLGKGDIQAARNLLHQAADLARNIGDKDALWYAGLWLLMAWDAPQHAKVAAQLADELWTDSPAGLKVRTAAAPQWLVNTFLILGNRQRAEELSNQMRMMAERTDYAAVVVVSKGIDAILALIDGRLADAVHMADVIRTLGQETGQRGMAHLYGTSVDLRAGIYLGIRETIERMSLESRRPGFAAVPWRTLALAHLGREQEATKILEGNVVRRADIGTTVDETSTFIDTLYLEASVLIGHRQAAEVLLNRFRGTDVHTSGIRYPTSVSRHLGGAAALLGRYDEARRQYQEAIRVCTEMRFRPELALTRLQLAELLLERYPDEKKDALDHLDFAIKEFREMKMQPSLERALRHKEILKA